MALKLERLRVLVIEDNQPMRALMASVLENLGVGRIFPSPSAENILDQMKEFEPDVIISDWQMEPVSGIDMTKTVRTDPTSTNPFIPIILITGYNSRKRVEQARDIGVTEFLIKPFKAQDVAKRLSHVINAPRDFVDAPAFFGPSRRRKPSDDYTGSKRRQEDRV